MARIIRLPGALAARRATLRYVSADAPGIVRTGKRTFVGPDARVIRSRAELERIRRLAIPPAWKDVWICVHHDGHLQATGRDARGRKQYRYHARWRAVRDENKYDRLIPFLEALPAIRATVEQDLALPGMPRRKVLALVVALLETTAVRVGNSQYARENKSFGLTTLRDQHVRDASRGLRLRFKGKSGVAHDVHVSDRRLASLIRRCRDLPGQDLFQFLDDDGRPSPITSSDVNKYLRDISGGDFTAKDFRTLAGTLTGLRHLLATRSEEVHPRRSPLELARTVSDALGNTVAVCRKCYIHPVIVGAAADASMRTRVLRLAARTRSREKLLLAVLRSGTARVAARRKAA